MFPPLFFAFIGGAISIAIVRIIFSSDESTFAATFAALIALLIIALLGNHYYRRPATDLRLAGDNLYYLGLLFTLVSLIVALVQLFVIQLEDDDVTQRTRDLIGNFGIALISTIAGILGRIWLQSLSDDQASERREDDSEAKDVPPTVPDSLMELRRTLREATDAFTHFTQVTQNQAEQVKAHSELLIHEFNTKMSAEAKHGLSEVMTTWRKSMEAIAADSNRLVKHIDEEVSASTARTETAWRGLAEELTTVSESARLQLASDATEISTILKRLAVTSEALNSLSAGLAVAESGTRSLGATASGTATTLDSRAVEIVDACNALVQGAKNVQQVGLAEHQEAIASFMEGAGEQLEQAGAKWLNSVTTITESAEARLKRASCDAEAVRLLGEKISEEADRSLTVVLRIRDFLESAVLQSPRAPVSGTGRWIEALRATVKRLVRRG